MSKRTRFWSGTNALILLCAGIGIVVLVNLLAGRVYVRADLTAQGVHTLSDASKQAVRALDDLEVRVYISKKLPAEVSRWGRTIPLQGVERQFLDKLSEYESAAEGRMTLVRVEEDIERKAEAANLQLFSADEARVQEGGRLEFTRYALGASFSFRNVSEVLPLAIEPEHYEFEITRILVRLKDKYEEGRLMADILGAGDEAFNAVKECNEAVAKYTTATPEAGGDRGAGTNPLIAGAEKAQQQISDLQAHRGDIQKACGKIDGAVATATAKLRGRNQDLDQLIANIAQYMRYYEQFDQTAGAGDPAQVQQAFRVAVALGQLFSNIDGAYQTLKSAPGRKTIGFFCGHDEFCPFPSDKPIIDEQIAGLMAQKNPLAKHFVEQAGAIEQQVNRINQQINQGLFRARGFEVQRVPKGEKISDDIDALVVFAPTKPLDQRDMFELDQFLLSGRPVIVLLKHFDVTLQNLNPETENLDLTSYATTESNVDQWLSNYGVVARKELVMEPRANGSVTVMNVEKRGRIALQSQRNYVYPLLPTFTDLNREHVLSKGLTHLTLPYVSPVEVTPELRKRPNVEIVELVRSSPNAVVMAQNIEILPPKLLDQISRQAPSGTTPVALFVKGNFDSQFSKAKLEDLPVKAREAGSDPLQAALATPEAPKAAAGDEPKKDDTPREFRRNGQGRLLVIGSNLGLEALSSAGVFDGFNVASLGEANLEVLKDLKKYAVRLQNWQLRIGQIGETIQETLQFLFNVFDWAVQKDALVEIRSKGSARRPLVAVSEGQQTALALGAVVALPLLFIGFGVGRFIVRERTRRRR